MYAACVLVNKSRTYLHNLEAFWAQVSNQKNHSLVISLTAKKYRIPRREVRNHSDTKPETASRTNI